MTVLSNKEKCGLVGQIWWIFVIICISIYYSGVDHSCFWCQSTLDDFTFAKVRRVRWEVCGNQTIIQPKSSLSFGRVCWTSVVGSRQCLLWDETGVCRTSVATQIVKAQGFRYLSFPQGAAREVGVKKLEGGSPWKRIQTGVRFNVFSISHRKMAVIRITEARVTRKAHFKLGICRCQEWSFLSSFPFLSFPFLPFPSRPVPFPSLSRPFPFPSFFPSLFCLPVFVFFLPTSSNP